MLIDQTVGNNNKKMLGFKIDENGLTHIGKIIDQNDVTNKVCRWTIENGMNGSKKYAPRLIVETYNNVSRWKII